MSLAAWLALVAVASCPPGELPTLRLTDAAAADLPAEERWQAVLNGVPVSEMQLAQLAGSTPWIDSLGAELKPRGAKVYGGMLTAALGTATSSIGWALLGGIEQNHVPQVASLSMALGGIVLGLAGVLWVTDAIQTPLEPYLAPTPRHRLSRDEAQLLVQQINADLRLAACPAVP